jgi:hypothetical protein
MTSFSLRRLILACTVSVAALVAVAAPGTASATTDLGEQCSGSNIKESKVMAPRSRLRF